MRTLAILVGCLAMAGPAGATTLVDVPLQTVVGYSDVAVVGTVVSVRAERTDDRPLTIYTLRVDRALTGAPGATLDLALLGGTLPDGRTVEVPGTPHFTEGERLLVHVAPVPGGLWRLTDWGAGLLRQRIGADGVPVAVDGTERPVETLPCAELATYADDLAAALPWVDAVKAAAQCGGAR
ncbi:MAG: hypothetical protein R3F59_00250 [Myxococcota bacterium]